MAAGPRFQFFSAANPQPSPSEPWLNADLIRLFQQPGILTDPKPGGELSLRSHGAILEALDLSHFSSSVSAQLSGHSSVPLTPHMLKACVWVNPQPPFHKM